MFVGMWCTIGVCVCIVCKDMKYRECVEYVYAYYRVMQNWGIGLSSIVYAGV